MTTTTRTTASSSFGVAESCSSVQAIAQAGSVRIYAGLLGSLSALLFLFQYWTLGKLSSEPPMVTHESPVQYIAYLLTRIDFDAADAALTAAILLLCAALLWLEIARGHLRAFLRGCLRSDESALLLLLAAGLVSCRYYVGPGSFSWAADASHHLMTAEIASRSLAEGNLPFWTNALGGGSPYLLFYGPLFFYVTALLDLLPGDTHTTLKSILWLAHSASGIGVYVWLRSSRRSRLASFVGGLSYILTFWHAQQVMVMGRYPLSLFYLLLPWAFAATDCLLHRPRPVSVPLAGGVSLGALVWVHPVYGAWAFVLLLTYVAIRTVGDPTLRRVSVFQPLVVLYLAAAAIASAIIVPMWWERAHTGMIYDFDLSNVPAATWMHLVVWSNYRSPLVALEAFEGNWYGGYLGLSNLLLAGTALAVAVLVHRRRRRQSQVLAAGVCFGLTAALALGGVGDLSLPGFQQMGSGRFLLFTVLFLSALSGEGAQWIATRNRQSMWRVAPLLVLVVDLGPTTFQQFYVTPPARTDVYGTDLTTYEPIRAEAAGYAETGRLLPYRAMWARGPMNPFATQSLLYHNTRAPMPHAPRPSELLAVIDFARPLERFLSQGLSRPPAADGRLSLEPLMFSSLRLLNVRYLLFTQSGGQVQGMSVPYAGPVIASSRLEPTVPIPADVDTSFHTGVSLASLPTQERRGVARALDTVAQYGLKPATSTARAIPVPASTPARDLGVQPVVGVQRHDVFEDQVMLELEMTSAGFVRLPYAYYPNLEVRRNGEQIEALKSIDHFTVVEVPAGRHEITLEARLSLLRRVLLGVAGLVILATIAAGLQAATRHHGRSSTSGPAPRPDQPAVDR